MVLFDVVMGMAYSMAAADVAQSNAYGLRGYRHIVCHINGLVQERCTPAH